jgi:hypothetical protein
MALVKSVATSPAKNIGISGIMKASAKNENEVNGEAA